VKQACARDYSALRHVAIRHSRRADLFLPFEINLFPWQTRLIIRARARGRACLVYTRILAIKLMRSLRTHAHTFMSRCLRVFFLATSYCANQTYNGMFLVYYKSLYNLHALNIPLRSNESLLNLCKNILRELCSLRRIRRIQEQTNRSCSLHSACRAIYVHTWKCVCRSDESRFANQKYKILIIVFTSYRQGVVVVVALRHCVGMAALYFFHVRGVE